MGNQFSFKEMESVVLKTTYPIEINGKNIEVGEVIAYFDKIQLANYKQITSSAAASGGFDNRKLVIWHNTKEVDFNFIQGIFNQNQYNVMLNAGLIRKDGENSIPVHQREIFGNLLTEDNNLYIKHIPNKAYKLYVYNSNGEKIHSISNPEVTKVGNLYKVNGIEINPSNEYTIDYKFDIQGATVMNIGRELITGYVELEGRTKVQDDVSGEFRSGIIKIPKLKLMSELSIRLGENASPIVSTLNAIGVPTGARGKEEVMEIIFLDDEIE